MPKKAETKKDNPKLKSTIADLYKLDGKTVGKITLPSEIFGIKINKDLLAQAVRIHLANKRSGTRDSKTRSEVTGSTKKIYRQKGTGRARHGDIKAPIFIGGGVTHGPKPQDFSLEFPKKMKKKALFSALTDKFENDAIRIVKDLKDLEQKTKNLVTVLKNLGYYQKLEDGKTKTLLVTDEKRVNLLFAGRNIGNLTMTPVNNLNAYEVLTHNNLVILPEAISKMTEIFINKKAEKVAVSQKIVKEIKTKKTEKKIILKKTAGKKVKEIKKQKKKA